MSFTPSTTVTNVHQSLGDFPAEDDHLTSEQLKELFDAPATGLKSSLNGLIGELEATTSAASLGAAAIADGDTSQANVQAKLEKIYQDLQDVALGEIPDGSITENKLTAEYSASIAKKDGTLQTNLNADKLGGVASSSYALKNGNLQTGLNSEKLGGSTKAQVISEVTNRQSPTDTNVTATYTSSTEVEQTITINNVKCRHYLVSLSTQANFNNASNKDQTFAAIFDCKTNKFIIAIIETGNSGSAKLRGNLTSLTVNDTYVSATLKNPSYSSGILVFTLSGKLLSGSSQKAYLRIVALDGLLP